MAKNKKQLTYPPKGKGKKQGKVFPAQLHVRIGDDDGWGMREFPLVVNPEDEKDGTMVGVYELVTTRVVRRTTELV